MSSRVAGCGWVRKRSSIFSWNRERSRRPPSRSSAWKVSTPARVSTYAYVNPVVAVALGAVLLGEAFTLRAALGTVLVVGSVALTLRRRQPSREAADGGGDPRPLTRTVDG